MSDTENNNAAEDLESKSYVEGFNEGIMFTGLLMNQMGHAIESGSWEHELPESLQKEDKEQALDMLAYAMSYVSSMFAELQGSQEAEEKEE